MVQCPVCKYENQSGDQICARCGSLMSNPSRTTTTLDDLDQEGTPRWGSAKFNEKKMNLVLDVLETSHSYVFDADTIDKIQLGRKDPHTGRSPDVDLSSVGAAEKGVSRQHAQIIFKDGSLHVVDNNSANGTFLNGQRLVARQPRILRDGDDVRLGRLVLRVTFRPAATMTAS